jgi:hypothetical protein
MTFGDAVGDAETLLTALAVLAGIPFLLYLTSNIGDEGNVSVNAVAAFIESLVVPNVGAILGLAVAIYLIGLLNS